MRPAFVRVALTKSGLIVEKGDQFYALAYAVADDKFSDLESLLLLSQRDLWDILAESSADPISGEELHILNPISASRTPVLGAGVTFSSSHRERRLETFRAGALVDADDDGRPTPYDVVYDPVNPPEVFFKALANGHLANPTELWIRPDGAPDGSMGSSVPEPERVLIVNPKGEIIAETIGSDTTARQLESRSSLYLPAAKTYPGCTTLNPWLTVFNPEVVTPVITIEMTIHRNGIQMYRDSYTSDQMKRTPESLVRHARTVADNPQGSFPLGFALFTGTGIIPPIDFSLEPGDQVVIASPELGRLEAVTKVVSFDF